MNKLIELLGPPESNILGIHYWWIRKEDAKKRAQEIEPTVIATRAILLHGEQLYDLEYKTPGYVYA